MLTCHGQVVEVTLARCSRCVMCLAMMLAAGLLVVLTWPLVLRWVLWRVTCWVGKFSGIFGSFCEDFMFFFSDGQKFAALRGLLGILEQKFNTFFLFTLVTSVKWWSQPVCWFTFNRGEQRSRVTNLWIKRVEIEFGRDLLWFTMPDFWLCNI